MLRKSDWKSLALKERTQFYLVIYYFMKQKIYLSQMRKYIKHVYRDVLHSFRFEKMEEYGGFYCHKVPLERIKYVLRRKYGDAHIECILVKFTKIVVILKNGRKFSYFLSEHDQLCLH